MLLVLRCFYQEYATNVEYVSFYINQKLVDNIINYRNIFKSLNNESIKSLCVDNFLESPRFYDYNEDISEAINDEYIVVTEEYFIKKMEQFDDLTIQNIEINDSFFLINFYNDRETFESFSIGIDSIINEFKNLP